LDFMFFGIADLQCGSSASKNQMLVELLDF